MVRLIQSCARSAIVVSSFVGVLSRSETRTNLISSGCSCLAAEMQNGAGESESFQKEGPTP